LLDEPTRSLDPVAAAKMRAFIASLAHATLPPVTVFLTSHNLAEVEELCERVAIISRGRIRALDAPKNLRALHRQTERVHLSIMNITRQLAQRLLSSRLKDFDLSEELDQILNLSFTREIGDDLLDTTLRLIQDGGGAILSCVTEQPTLLDVLESYERDEQEDEQK